MKQNDAKISEFSKTDFFFFLLHFKYEKDKFLFRLFFKECFVSLYSLFIEQCREQTYTHSIEIIIDDT